MKSNDVIDALTQDGVQKRVLDSVRNALATYVRLFDDDEITHILPRWDKVFPSFQDHLTSIFTLRNYVTAIRDMLKSDAIRENHLNAGMSAEEFDKALALVEMSRTHLIKSANAEQRARRSSPTKQEDTTMDIEINDETDHLEEPEEPEEPEISESGETRTSLECDVAWLKIENKALQQRLNMYKAQLETMERLFEKSMASMVDVAKIKACITE